MSNHEATKSHIDVRILAAVWIAPLLFYVAQIDRWSLSGDEYYTLVDSSKPVAELLSYERKPLYYLICHFLLSLNLNLPVEVVIRIPAAVAASLIAPAFYGILSTKRSSNVALFAALIALANPWLFQMSQFGRFYSLAFLFAAVSGLAAYRWLYEPSNWRWILIFAVAGLLAGLSHTPAVIVIPAGVVALLAASLRDDPQRVIRFLRRYGLVVCGVIVPCVAAGMYFLKDMLHFWLNSNQGQFGNYSAPQILVALAIFGGISTWMMATLPLLRMPTSWTSRDVYLLIMVALSSVPILMLAPMGGGVAARYLMFCLPCMFVLAARNWHEIDERLPTVGYRAAVAFCLFSFNLPYVTSIYTNGDHFDYRAVAKKVDSMNLHGPIIVATGHELLNYYMEVQHSDFELGNFEAKVPREVIQKGIDIALAEKRPLILVSREDRSVLSQQDQDWLYSRFALVHADNKPRYDHRRHRTAIYQYRPDPSHSCEAALERLTAKGVETNAVDDPEISTAP